ncbi:hypothetical protein BH10PLA2_BH10PLA2_22170 [soil metagenome]
MSRLGKIGLFLNLALALLFAVWGFGVFINRTDWTLESKTRADQLQKLSQARNKVLEQVQLTRPLYVIQESRRPVLDKFYAEQLEALRSGKDTPRALVYSKGVLQYDPTTNLPRLGPVVSSGNQPLTGLASQDVLAQKYAGIQEQIRTVMKEEAALVEEQKKLSIELYGEGMKRGLRGDLADRLAADQKSLDRHEYLMPLLYNRQAELQILTRRHEGLEARLKELQGTNLSTRR